MARRSRLRHLIKQVSEQSSGGAVPQVVNLEPLLSFPSPFSYGNGACYLNGHELVCRQLVAARTGNFAIDNNAQTHIATFNAPFYDLDPLTSAHGLGAHIAFNDGEFIEGNVWVNGFSEGEGERGKVIFLPHSDKSAVNQDQYFIIPELRILLADLEGARAALEAL